MAINIDIRVEMTTRQSWCSVRLPCSLNLKPSLSYLSLLQDSLFSVCVRVYVMNLFLLLRIWALGLTQPQNLAQDVRIVKPLYEILGPYLQHSM